MVVFEKFKGGFVDISPMSTPSSNNTKDRENKKEDQSKSDSGKYFYRYG